MMQKMRAIYDLAYTRIPDRKLNVKQKPVQKVFKKSPDENSQREKQKDFYKRALRFGVKGEAEENSRNRRKDPEGAKSVQPLCQAHIFIIIGRSFPEAIR
jgi:hypothetical protein